MAAQAGRARKRTTNSEVVGSFRGDPTETEQRLAQGRKHLPKGHSLKDVQLEALSDQLYAFATVIVDVYLEKRKQNPLARKVLQVSGDSALGVAVQ